MGEVPMNKTENEAKTGAEKILISSCLLGKPVRYDGKSVPLEHSLIETWKSEGRLIPVCPEVLGGLPVPRPSAEIMGASTGDDVLAGKAEIKTVSGNDVTSYFLSGAKSALESAKSWNIKIAILKENSPSCGSSFVYDGTFSRNKIQGSGATTALLRQHGIQVFSENEIELAQAALLRLNPKLPT